MYSAVLISAGLQCDSIIHTYTYFFIFFSIMVYYRILSIVPCAIQSDFVVYPSYIYWFASAIYKLPIHPSPTFPPLWQPQVCSVYEPVL